MASATKLVRNVEAAPALAEHALITIEEVAEILNVPVSWVYERTRRRSANRIPGFRLGKYWRFRETDVLAWIERQRIGARPNV
jgi:excisionase family DNA binding protein